ncbi:MAG: SurA N-terminal domain-containing protein [Sedimenticola sp.]
MLQSIRERAQGVIAWIIVVLISVPFALWGIQEYLGVGSENIVATVNGQEITEREFEVAFRDFKQGLRERMGSNYRPELIDDQQLRKEVLEAMIRNALVHQASDSLGLKAGNAAVRDTILGIRSFQVDGRFNQQAYERAVRNQGMSTTAFEERVRQSIVSEQISKAIRGSEFATSSEMETLVRLQQQKRELAYITVPAASYADQVSVSDEQVRSHYDNNQSAYMAPERARVDYLELDDDSISTTLDVDEETLKGYYEQHKDEYVTREQRRASHILFTLEAGADDETVAAAEAAARAALSRINGGESFATVAKELSQDPGSADLGGDLDYFEKGVMAPAFDEAVFSMQKGGLSEPVKSDFGYHVIQLTDIRPSQGKSFDEAKDDLRKAYLRSEAERLFYEYAERLSDLSYEDPGSLEPAAEALGIPVKQGGWVTRSGGDGIFASPKVIGAVFSADVLLDGNNSEAIELAPEHIVVLRVREHEESSVKPFDSVASEIREQLQQEGAASKAREKGQALLAALAKGTGMSELAGQEGLGYEEKGYVERTDRTIAEPVLKELFRMPRPSGAGASYSEAVLDGGDFALIALSGVEDGKMEQAAQLGGEDILRGALQRARGENYYQKMVENLRASADISILRDSQ